jgi:hypothetical protein
MPKYVDNSNSHYHLQGSGAERPETEFYFRTTIVILSELQNRSMLADPKF